MRPVTIDVRKPEMELVKQFWNAVDKKGLAAELPSTVPSRSRAVVAAN